MIFLETFVYDDSSVLDCFCSMMKSFSFCVQTSIKTTRYVAFY